MKQRIRILLRDPLLQLMMAGVFSYTAFTAVIIAVMQTPPEAILNIGLQEILMIFEGEG